jgi:mRNA interferase RelE/StbE
MAYALVIKQQARKKIQSLSRVDRVRVTEQLKLLGLNPGDPELDIKKLVGEPYYRLRIGNWRVIFDRHDQVKIITIEKIKARGDVYK